MLVIMLVGLGRRPDGTLEVDPEVQAMAVHETGTGQTAAGPVARVQGQVYVERVVVPPELDPPPAGQCTVIPWQQGERVGEPTPCADGGAFEVALHPGRQGRTAFEILVPGYLRAVLEADVPEGGAGRLPAVALGPAVRVDGQVVDVRGEPLTGIAIEAMPRPNLGEPEPWRAQSGADGAFVLDTLPPGPVTLHAGAPGYAPSVVEVIAPQAEILITLQALVDLRGRVVGPAEALARARVRIEGSGIWPVREQAVELDGGFVLTEVPDGIYALEAVVEAVEPGQGELASIPLENVTPELAITLALVPAFRVPVQVQAPDGTKVAGARVTLSNSSIGLLPRLSVTDAEGKVAMGPVVPGPYVLRAHADGFLPSPPIALAVDGPDTPLQVLTLAEPGRIEGRVVDEEGHPVEDARVELLADHLFTAGESQARARLAQTALQSSGSLGVTTGPVPAVPQGDEEAADLGTSVRSGPGGRFVFDMLVPGHYRLEASHGHYARSEELEVRLGSARVRADLELVLRTGQRLTGRVRDGNDRPVEGAMVVFDDGRRAYTDRRGHFDGGIRRGPQQLVAHADGLAPAALDVVVQDEPLDVEIVLGRAGGRLTGRVVGGNGEVLVDARVTLRTLDGLSATRVAWTDDKGVYGFEDLPPGPLEIEVDHPEHGPATAPAELPGEDARVQLDVALSPGWAIDVEVREESTGEPLPGVRVEGGGAHARTDGEGRATLPRITDERVQVAVRAEGYGLRELWVQRAGSDRRTIRIELAEGGGLRGRVIDYRGDPVAGVEVVVSDAEGVELGRAQTDARGRWALAGVPAGDVEVSVDPPVDREEELAPAALATDVLRGHVTRDVDLRLDPR
jgi:Carboxypeptidase regulatory-like domain